MQATMLDFRRRMSEIQGAISRRERVTVTSHGRPWAVIVAWEDAKPDVPSARDCAAAGMWADREDLASPTDYVRNLRARRRFA
ncbi:MAG: type II toxin-antitoxin system prevent-host-death family antitoxin [Kiritimatiellae bacterium]|jgi:prevent-host-death family protein|nr:type II toxin-antitoxin system prevent-host-death family antitoxin [Kiritimatiellia bacterium]